MKIINYNILRHPNPEALENAVRHSINNGWQPYGNLVVEPIFINNQETLFYIQTMVAYQAEE